MDTEKIPSEFASWLTINRACNLNCDGCYASPIRFRGTSNMSLETAQKNINFFKSLPLKRVILIGGEPTIHPDFLSIVRIIKESSLTPVVITNGIKFRNLLFLKQSLDAGIAGITISLKGSSDEQYKLLSGRAAFSDVMTAIHNIIDSGVDHNLSITIGDGLFPNFNKMIEAIVKSGVKWFSLDMERTIIVNNQAIFPGNSSPQEMADFFVSIYQQCEECGTDFVFKISLPFCLFPAGFIEKLKEKRRIVSGCHIYTGAGIIMDPAGKLLPCNHFCDNPLGELGKDFSDGCEYLQFRERPDITRFYKTVSSYPDGRCRNCNYWPECGAGCRTNWLHWGANELLSSKGGDKNESPRATRLLI